MRTTPPGTIEVFADLWCTFAHVGLRVIDDRRRGAGRSDVIVVRAWPLELVNGEPMDVAKTLDHVRELQEHVAPQLFRDFDGSRFPTSTIEALALVARAYRTDPHLGERASFAIRDRLFEENLQIDAPDVLRALADELGTGMPDDDDRATVLDDWAEGQRRGVVGSPHFFAGGRDAFCPSLDITRADAGLTITSDATGLSAFLDVAFATPGAPPGTHE